VIFNQTNFPSILQRHLFSYDVFTGVRAGQSVTHHSNSKPQGYNDPINS